MTKINIIKTDIGKASFEMKIKTFPIITIDLVSTKLVGQESLTKRFSYINVENKKECVLNKYRDTFNDEN
jgi:hypothetical protein